MKAYEITLLVIDHDNLGAAEVIRTLESTSYPNDCINPHTITSRERDIGEWDDTHPLNNSTTFMPEYHRLFTDPKQDAVDRVTALQRGFEQWALNHGGINLERVDSTTMTCDNGWFPANYKDPATEIAWRAAANLNWVRS